MFPELHETFILRELAALERAGLKFEIYSLQYPRDPVTLEDAKRLMDQKTHYQPIISLSTLSAFISSFMRHPIKLIGTVSQLVRIGWKQPKELMKCLAILPLSLHFGRLARQRGISHLHGHWANIPTTACWFLQHIEGFSWSAAIHGEDIFSPNPILEMKLKDALFTVVCSGHFCQHLKTALNQPNPNKIHCNYHGLDPLVWEKAGVETKHTSTEHNHNPGDTCETVELLSIGRLVPTKGHDHLIRACSKLSNPNWKLSIIGSGPDKDSLTTLIQSLKLEKKVTLLGALEFDKVLDTLKACDIFCLPAKMIPGHPPDGIPNVLAEAMAFGKPVVTSDMGAIPELVKAGENGLLTQPGDEQSITLALQQLVDDKDYRLKLGLEAKNTVAHLFDQDKNINELLAYFRHYLKCSK